MTDSTPKPPTRVRFHYLKSNNFRVIHVDGAVGSSTPSGMGIHMTLFSERSAIPQQLEFELSEEGKIGKEIPESKITREGIVRELEVDAIMSLDRARALHAWLGNQIKTLEDLQRTHS